MTTEPQQLLGGSGVMFDRIASRYDRLNRILSLGLDQRWRKRAVSALSLPPIAHVLDVATGTADVALYIAQSYPDVTVVGVDPSANMLAIGQRKLADAGVSGRVSLELGDAQALRFGAATFDAAIIAFGIRNVPDRELALREIARVVRPSGRLAVLELSEPKSGLFGSIARFHVRTVVPSIGAWLSGAAEYRYLQRSIAAFPAAPDFAQLMTNNGWTAVTATPLSFGAVHLYQGSNSPVVSGAQQ